MTPKELQDEIDRLTLENYRLQIARLEQENAHLRSLQRVQTGECPYGGPHQYPEVYPYWSTVPMNPPCLRCGHTVTPFNQPLVWCSSTGTSSVTASN